MAQNVAEIMSGRASTLFEKLSSNQDVANTVMAFLGRIVVMCHQTGKRIEGVETGEVNESDGDFRFALSFNNVTVTPMGLWQPQGDILSYARSRSVHLAKVLERNAKLMRTLSDLVEMIDQFCERKRIKFSEFTVKKAMIHPSTNVCIIRYGKPTAKDAMRRGV